MFKRRKGFVLLAPIVGFLFVLGCAGSSKETKEDEGATPRTLPA